MDAHIQAIIQYWQQGLWRETFNALPLSATLVPLDAQVTQVDVHNGRLLGERWANVSGNVWIAPMVFEKKGTTPSYWIPLWLGAKCDRQTLAQRDKTTLPWIPSSQCCLHRFDDACRFEFLEQTPNTWQDFYQQSIALLNSVSNTGWQDVLTATGFHLTDKAWVISAAQLIPPLSEHSLLLENFAQWDDIQPKPLRGPRVGLETALHHVLNLAPGELLAIQAPIGSDKEKFIAAIGHGFSIKPDRIPMCLPTEKIDLLIVEDAHLFSAASVVPYLAHAQRAVFLGDQKAFTKPPVMGSLQEEIDLADQGLGDEHMIEQLHYKGMLNSTGNAFVIAMANSAYQEEQYGIFASTLSLMDPQQASNRDLQAIWIAAQSVQTPKGLTNFAEAEAIIQWLQSQQLTPEAVVIVTPFEAQKNLLQDLLAQAGLSYNVYLLPELPARQWLHVVFSSVYTHSDRRPFIFDQGEAYFYTLLSHAIQRVLLFADPAIFDPKMHSPSGKIAKTF